MKKLISLFVVLFIFNISYSQEQEVLYKYNTNTGKYHRQECKWAIKCTKNCIDLTLKEIKDRKGIPCKVCKPPRY